MDFSLTEDQQSIVTLAREVFGGTAAREEAYVWAQLARTDLLRVALPEAAGGLAGGMIELSAVHLEAGRAASDVPVSSTLTLGALPLAQLAAAERWSQLLADVGSGSALLTAALVDAADRAPVAARRSADGYSLSGVKTCVPDADRAKRIVVAATREDGGSMLAPIDPQAAGVGLAPQQTTSGRLEFELTLSDVVVAEDDVLLARAGREPVGWLAERAATALCAYQLGLCEDAVRRTAEYASERVQFGRPIGTFQALQHRLADAHIDVAAMRWTMWNAAWRLDAGLPGTRAVAAATYWAAYGGRRVMTATLHLHGGLGVDVTYPMHRYFLRGKQTELALGGATRSLAALGEQLVHA